MSLEQVPLSSLATITSGGGAPQESDAFSDIGYPFIRAGSLIKLLNGASEHSLEKIAPQTASKYRLKLFPKNSILFAKSGMSATKGYVYRLKSEAYIVNHLAVLIPHKEADAAYLQRVLEAKSPVQLIKDEAYPSIRLGDIESMLVPAPQNTSDRIRIAAILDKADEVRVKRRQALEKLEGLAQAVFVEMFGDALVPVKTIKNLLEEGFLLLHKDGNHGTQYPRAEEFGSEGIPFLSAQCIEDNGSINELKITKLNEKKARSLKIGWIKSGDVLLAHNASVGKVALYDGQFAEALIGTSLTCFRPNPERLTSEYLFAALRSKKFQSDLSKDMSQTTRNQVPITAQRDLYLPIPSIDKQIALSEKIRPLAKSITLYRSQVDVLNEMFDSLQQRVFRGEL